MSDRLEFRIGQYLRGMEEILKVLGGTRSQILDQYRHEEHYNNSSGVKSLAVPIVSSSPIAKIENLIIMPSMPPPDSSGTREPKEIKQIATLGSGEIVALCNDSTVWIYAGSGWQKLPDLPNDDGC
jgi:hypothetical protein